MRMSVLILTVFCVASALSVVSNPAQACCSCTTKVEEDRNEWWGGADATVNRIENYLDGQFTGLREFIIGVFWEDNVLPAMMRMSDQLTAVAMQQVEIFGAFLDAKHQMETQQVFQKIAARAHKDYHPSTGMCEFGSAARSLAASERKAEFNAVLLSQRSQDRALGNQGVAAATGDDGDKESRLKQFREKFCDPSDNNNGLAYLCDHDQNFGGGAVGASDRERMNKDIDYVRAVEAPWTLNIDFTDSTLTDNEEEILALASNLYGHDVFLRMPSQSLESQDGEPITNAQKHYLDMRSVLAKRSVAENSFNAITAMKSNGTPGAQNYLEAILEELGVPGSETVQMLGQNPSYYAQMEVLTKKIYQNPDFYTNLYDKPVNVDRKGVALQAIGLMQKFDLFKSYLRNEASLSVLLELAVTDLQGEVENEINPSASGIVTPAP